MPARPPVFRPPGWRQRKAWAPRPGNATKRKRGRAGQRDRQLVIAEEPFCRRCLEAEGKHVAVDVVDHIVPLAWGGPDERWNKQSLCHRCHDAKSLLERQQGRPPGLEEQLRRLEVEGPSGR